MQRPLRYKVNGFIGNVPITTVFKSLKSAIKYAQTHVSKPQLFDIIENKPVEVSFH